MRRTIIQYKIMIWTWKFWIPDSMNFCSFCATADLSLYTTDVSLSDNCAILDEVIIMLARSTNFICIPCKFCLDLLQNWVLVCLNWLIQVEHWLTGKNFMIISIFEKSYKPHSITNYKIQWHNQILDRNFDNLYI